MFEGLATDITQSPAVWSLFVTATVFLLAGVLGLYMGASVAPQTEWDLRELVAILIALVWVLSTVAQIVVPGYQTSIYVHGLMGAVAGWLFGLNRNTDILTPNS